MSITTAIDSVKKDNTTIQKKNADSKKTNSSKKPLFEKITMKTTKKDNQDDGKSKKEEFGQKEKSAKKKFFTGWRKKILLTLISLLFLFLLMVGGLAAYVYFYILPPVNETRQTVMQLQQQANTLKTAAKAQDLTTIKTELSNVRNSLQSLQGTIKEFSWVQSMPYVDVYWQDSVYLTNGAESLLHAGDIAVNAMIPYADLLGFTVSQELVDQYMAENSESTDLEVENEQQEEITSPINVQENTEPITAKDRISFVVSTLDALVPQLDSISAKLAEADQEFQKIDKNRYPEDFQGQPVRSYITQVKDLTAQARILTSDAKPLLEVAPFILGNDEPRDYLVLFQNDAELRPTGGFLTAYAMLEVDKGKVEPKFSKDIYDLDARYSSDVAAFDALIKYIPDPYAKEASSGKTAKLRLRDSNISPDFKEAMSLFYEEYLKVGGSQPVDGIVAVDTQLLVDLLKLTGPIGVGGVGNFSAEIVPECNCPQVVYALESAISYETPFIRQNRKAIIGPLMHSVLSNAMATPKEKMSELVNTGLQAVQEKHVLMYFPNEEVQEAVESFNLAGRVVDAANDYLLIVDTNFAGAKSNLYVTKEVEMNVTTGQDIATHELTITYRNPQAHDGWLNGDFRNWLRVYVPQGSNLLEANGTESELEVSEELGKTVFDGFLVVRPEGLAKVTIKYETPVQQKNPYQLLIQKQGGVENFFYMITVDGQRQEFDLDGDKRLEF